MTGKRKSDTGRGGVKVGGGGSNGWKQDHGTCTRASSDKKILNEIFVLETIFAFLFFFVNERTT